MSERTRQVLLIGAALLAALIIIPLAIGALRELLVIPLINLLWTLYLAATSLPELLYWIALIVVGIFIAIGSLTGLDALDRTPDSQQGVRTSGRVSELAEWVQDLTYGSYFHRRLANHMLNLTLQTKGFHERPSVRDLVTLLEHRAFNLPPAARDYLQTGLQFPINDSAEESDQPATSRFFLWNLLQRWLVLPIDSGPVDTGNLEHLIDHLEQELEIVHDQPEH